MGAGTCLFAWPPALHPASALLSTELGSINTYERIEDEPLLCVDVLFALLQLCAPWPFEIVITVLP